MNEPRQVKVGFCGCDLTITPMARPNELEPRRWRAVLSGDGASNIGITSWPHTRTISGLVGFVVDIDPTAFGNATQAVYVEKSHLLKQPIEVDLDF